MAGVIIGTRSHCDMNSTQALPSDMFQANRSASPDRARLFYAGAAALLLVLMFLGFQQFYLHGRAFPNRPLMPAIRTLVITHGIAMSLWVTLLLVQPLLVVNRKYRVHMAVGKFGAVLAVFIFVLGFELPLAWARIDPSRMFVWSMTAKEFMAVPLISVLIFAGFVATGIVNRRRSEIHRPMMLLATLTVISAATDRIPAIVSLFDRTIWGTTFGPFFPPLVVGALLLIVKWALTRSFDRYFAVGWVGLVVADAGIVKLATTQTWDGIADFLLRI
ncbi:MAG TPA: hypothetical protein VN325_34730 [Steroidobacteraceae bacterium]|nr:hypothetical protein [Steroidobacteraceae bacterium]